MSVFEKSGEQTPSLPFQDPNQVGLDDLVGEDKKFKTVEELVKSYAHGQNHMVDLKQTAERFEKEAEKAATLEDVIAKIQEGKETTPNSGEPNTEGEPEGTPTEPQKEAEPIDFDKLINQKFAEKEAQTTAEKNAAEVREALIKQFGTQDAAQSAFEAKVSELGMTVESLNEIASRNPAAALKLLDVSGDTPKTGNLQQYRRPVANAQPDPNNPTTLEDFNALRREDFNKWKSPAVQRKLNALVRQEGN